VPLRIIGRAIKPSAAEVARNPRARSAVLRIAERTAAALPTDWPRGFEGEWA
jgi:16S rRNA (cytosine1402-N4)-methyltransferase